MFKKMELIDITDYSVAELRELAKDDNVFFMYNSYAYETKLLRSNANIDMIPKDQNECWRVRPLSHRVNDKRSDSEVEIFAKTMERNYPSSVFRIEIA